MSVMHYRQYAFSKNRKPTILPKRPVPYLRCRGIDCPSELDIKKINFLYKCHKKDDYYDDRDSGFGDKDLDNEVTVDEIFVNPKHGGDSLDEFNPDSEMDQEPCLDGEPCSYRPFKAHKSMLYPSYGTFAFDDVHPRDHLLHRKLRQSGKGKRLPRFHRAHPYPPLIGGPLELY